MQRYLSKFHAFSIISLRITDALTRPPLILSNESKKSSFGCRRSTGFWWAKVPLKKIPNKSWKLALISQKWTCNRASTSYKYHQRQCVPNFTWKLVHQNIVHLIGIAFIQNMWNKNVNPFLIRGCLKLFECFARKDVLSKSYQKQKTCDQNCNSRVLTSNLCILRHTPY